MDQPPHYNDLQAQNYGKSGYNTTTLAADAQQTDFQNADADAYYNSMYGITKPATAVGDPKLASMQQQVDETVLIMRDNMAMALDRDEKLTDLEDKADELAASSKRFKKTTQAVKHEQWKKNMKWLVLLIVAILVLILVIILITQPWKYTS